MICIYCLSQKTRVLNSRAHHKNPLVWRRRTCTSCGKIFTSYERPSCDDLLIENSHGESNRFNIGTLTISIYLASQHNKKQALHDSFYIAQTVEMEVIKISANRLPNDHINTYDLVKITYSILKRFDEAIAMQYAIQQGYISSIKRQRGRPSIQKNDNY